MLALARSFSTQGSPTFEGPRGPETLLDWESESISRPELALGAAIQAYLVEAWLLGQTNVPAALLEEAI